jgi:hypothetical protein
MAVCGAFRQVTCRLARLSQLGREFRYFLETICQFPNDFVENFSKLRLVQTQSLLNLVVELID